MRITGQRTTLLALPADEPLAGAVTRPGTGRPTVLLELQTDAGLEGIGFTFLGAALSPALRAAVEGLADILVGDDALATEALRAKLIAAAGGCGPGGIFALALAAIDIALWDLRGKALGAPLWRLLGARDAPVPTYASGALMRELPLDRTLAAAGTLVAQGFSEVKMQLALQAPTSPAHELDRARRIREVVGADVRLMCDINQRWRPDEAMAMGRQLEEIGFYWIEDIAPSADPAALGRIAAGLATPLAAGEYLYGLAEFRALLEAGGANIVMIDPFRAGGITGWLRTAALAEAHGLPVVSHLAPEIQVHLIPAIPNGLTVEFMPWSVAMFEEVPWPHAGKLALPQDPGLGLRVDRRAVERYRA
jgi:L-alanine-DL-glutamate epimerase-like enolase superfamily enzyme